MAQSLDSLRLDRVTSMLLREYSNALELLFEVLQTHDNRGNSAHTGPHDRTSLQKRSRSHQSSVATGAAPSPKLHALCMYMGELQQKLTQVASALIKHQSYVPQIKEAHTRILQYKDTHRSHVMDKVSLCVAVEDAISEDSTSVTRLGLLSPRTQPPSEHKAKPPSQSPSDVETGGAQSQTSDTGVGSDLHPRHGVKIDLTDLMQHSRRLSSVSCSPSVILSRGFLPMPVYGPHPGDRELHMSHLFMTASQMVGAPAMFGYGDYQKKAETEAKKDEAVSTAESKSGETEGDKFRRALITGDLSQLDNADDGESGGEEYMDF